MTFKLTPIAISLVLSLGLLGCNSDNNKQPEITTPDTSLPATPIINMAVLKYIDPMIGTAASGHTFPGAVVPRGMVQLSPDTFKGTNADTEAGQNPWHSASGYWDASDYVAGDVLATDLNIYGFSHTHLSGTGATDLGDILVLPYSDIANSENNAFNKATEIASPGYYSVVLNNGNIKAELTTTTRVGVHRYTYAPDADRKIKLDLAHTLTANNGESLQNRVELVDEYTIRGRRVSTGWFQGQDIFFYAQFNQPIAHAMIARDGGDAMDMQMGAVYGSINSPNKEQITYLDFGKGNQPIEMRVALSPVDWEGAQKNLEAETPTYNFANVKVNAELAWAKELATVQVKGGSEAEKTNFYTAMYHAMIAPVEYQDVDGRYRDLLGAIRQADGYKNYSVYSTWDTFRAVHPLLTITNPQHATDLANDLIRKSQETGLLPKWEGYGEETGTMIGYPATAIIGDAVVKGLNVDPQDALEAAKKSAYYRPYDFPQIPDHTLQAVMAGQLSYYERDKCVGLPNWNSVSYALEFSYYDWTIAQMAKAAGDDAAYNEFNDRAYWSLNHWDKEAGFFVPVKLNSCEKEFASDAFNPYSSDALWYTEGNAWQWQWTFMQDLDKLTEVMGGTEGFNTKLNDLFTADANGGENHQDMTGFIGQYIHGNEPSHHVIYLYNRTNESWKTQQYLDKVYKEFYKPTPDGIIGNEDVGQMSAWYIMSAMGFYQVTPTDPTYTIGRPIFDEVTIKLPTGDFTITAENNSSDNKYVKSALINSKPLDVFNSFEHSEIKAGGTLHFVMTADKSQAMAARLN
ncbi:GH92 family glycosyl hydrolase [Photobacterium phosphoreum]|uniref:GH92 family glycosyl hydrolase n=1 Tax=Photobacterium phosphoreum TaxID=659 RepID=UPI0024BA86A6|nr:GH92 family glycosyl hydrolase [Photobacterium phosphoreum]